MISQFVIPLDYFEMSLDARKNMCQDIIKQILEKTRLGEPEYVLNYLNKVLKNNEEQFVHEENYVGAQVFADLQNALWEQFNNIEEKNG